MPTPLPSNERDLAQATRLAQVEERTAALLKSTSDMVAVLDPAGHIQYVSPVVERVLGYAPEALAGRNVFEFMDPDSVTQARTAFANTVQEQGEAVPLEVFMRHRDGHAVATEIIANNQLTNPLIHGVVITGRDITERKQNEAALRRSEERYRSLIEHSIGFICTHTLDGTLLSVNPAAARALGYPADAWSGRNMRDFLIPEARAGFDEYIQRLLALGEDTDSMRVLRADGAVRIWAYQNVVLREPGAEPYVLGYAYDITEQREAEQRIRESEEKYRDLFENAMELVQSVAPDGRIEYANPTWRKTLGYSEEELSNLNIFALVAPEKLAAYRNLFERLFASEDIGHFETVLVAKSGQRIPVEGTSSLRFGPKGKPESARAIFRDISERRAAERQLRLLTGLQSAILKSANYSVVSTTPHGVITLFNLAAERMLGYTAEEMVGKKTPEVIHVREEVMERAAELTKEFGVPVQTGFDTFVFRAMRTGQPDAREWTYVRKDGSRFPVLLSVTPLFAEDGRISGFLGIADDITERKAAEVNLKRAQDKLRQALEKERELSRRDFLTGLNNRRAFFEVGEFEAARSRRYLRPMAIAYVDLDNFKHVNDTLGHEVGDDLLVVVASTLQANLRTTDIIARLGGDEFAVLLPETGSESAEQVMSKMREVLLENMAKNGWPVTFSIGVITFKEPTRPFEEMIREADQVMYSVKRSGKNRVATAVAPS